MMKSILKLGVGAIALCALQTQAGLTINVGDTVYETSTDNSTLLQPGAETGYINNGVGGAANQDVYAGSFTVQLNDVNTATSGTVMTFCTDVGADWQFNNGNPVKYTATSFGSVNGVNPAWSAVPESVQNAAWIYNKYFLEAGPLNPEQAAAVQLAIWKVLYDTTASGGLDASGDTFSAGQFQANSFFGSTIADAEGYINDMLTARGNGSFTTYTETWLDPSIETQGLLFDPMIGNNELAVPEPTTVFAGMLLLLPLGASTFRIFRNRKATVI